MFYFNPVNVSWALLSGPKNEVIINNNKSNDVRNMCLLPARDVIEYWVARSFYWP